jgi:hypothetical protein
MKEGGAELMKAASNDGERRICWIERTGCGMGRLSKEANRHRQAILRRCAIVKRIVWFFLVKDGEKKSVGNRERLEW